MGLFEKRDRIAQVLRRGLLARGLELELDVLLDRVDRRLEPRLASAKYFAGNLEMREVSANPPPYNGSLFGMLVTGYW